MLINPTKIAGAISEDGYFVSRVPLPDAPEPWSFVASLLGERPEMVERQPIRPIESGRSFASTRVFTPLHTDSQDFRGAPPALQLMMCRRAADNGGATHLVDGFALLEHIERDDPTLHESLFRVIRIQRFYFGDVVGPTVALKRGHLVWTHSPMPPNDNIGHALAAWFERVEPLVIPIATGETLFVDNPACFTDARRSRGRTASSSACSPGSLARDSSAPRRKPRARSRTMFRSIRRPRQLPPTTDSRWSSSSSWVPPPAKLAAREGMSEAELYDWRSRALDSARHALTR